MIEIINRCLLFHLIVETAEYSKLSLRVRAHRNVFGGEFKYFSLGREEDKWLDKD